MSPRARALSSALYRNDSRQINLKHTYNRLTQGPPSREISVLLLGSQHSHPLGTDQVASSPNKKYTGIWTALYSTAHYQIVRRSKHSTSSEPMGYALVKSAVHRTRTLGGNCLYGLGILYKQPNKNLFS